MKSVLDRFLKYVQIETTSNPNSTTYPSTTTQTSFLTMLKNECEEIGLTEVTMDKYGYVMATIEANCDTDTPTIGFIAHVDTSPDMSGSNVKPRIIKNYDGKDILLNEAKNIQTKVSDFPELKEYIGQTLIVTDGTTLLGADDKAGIAEIITASEYLMLHPEIKHGRIRICFTPDEEIGKGTDHFSVEKFGAQHAYTIDGGSLATMEYETFNAASAIITVYGRNVHPGYAKDKMINSIQVAMKLHSELPREFPENTGDREGFFHLNDIKGSVEKTELHYIIRDHSTSLFEQRKSTIKSICKRNSTDSCKIECLIEDQYYNMANIISNGHMVIVDRAKMAMGRLGLTPIIHPIRGGTDGSRLSYMGLPCPNLFAGGENFHSRNEYASLQTIEKAVELIVEIVRCDS